MKKRKSWQEKMVEQGDKESLVFLSIVIFFGGFIWFLISLGKWILG
jgi:hypothetical protein